MLVRGGVTIAGCYSIVSLVIDHCVAEHKAITAVIFAIYLLSDLPLTHTRARTYTDLYFCKSTHVWRAA